MKPAGQSEQDRFVLRAPWRQAGWDFWQNTYQDVVPGITAKVDRNVFRGQIQELLEMID